MPELDTNIQICKLWPFYLLCVGDFVRQISQIESHKEAEYHKTIDRRENKLEKSSTNKIFICKVMRGRRCDCARTQCDADTPKNELAQVGRRLAIFEWNWLELNDSNCYCAHYAAHRVPVFRFREKQLRTNRVWFVWTAKPTLTATQHRAMSIAARYFRRW